MYKYEIGFSKTGMICYTSHLDIMRMFIRAIRRAGIRLSYSQGFNPHPRIVFAQPLSLGYEGLHEMMEIETDTDYEPEDIKDRLSALMPEGVDILECVRKPEGRKKLAALTVAARYVIEIPYEEGKLKDGDSLRDTYLAQERIPVMKRRKKKKPAEVDIRPMIRSLDIDIENGTMMLDTVLDSGSISNLSPELLIKTLLAHAGYEIERGEIEVRRMELYFEDLK